MDEFEDLKQKYRPLSEVTVPEDIRTSIHTMIAQHESALGKRRSRKHQELLRTGGAVIAAVLVFCVVVFDINKPSSSDLSNYTSGASGVMLGNMDNFVPYLMLLGVSAVLLVAAWVLRRSVGTVNWAARRTTGVRWYDSAQFQVYIAVLYSWVMFSIFVAPSSTSPWVGVLAFLIFCVFCGGVRDIVFSVVVLLITAIPAWWLAVEPSGHLLNWYPLIVFNIVFFILTPGIIIIPLRNFVIRRFMRRRGR